MNVFRTADEMRVWSRAQRAQGRTIGFVPTMGDLHDGHLSLMRASAAACDTTVASIYVNETQFAPHEDFDAYPRNFERDAELATEAGVEAIYAPVKLYPEGYSTFVTVENESKGLCSNTRPHFFRGVATVVTKLFNAVEPDIAYFGQKDAQQCAVIQRMTADLDMPIRIVTLPTVREPDGLAMSSRNRYLSDAERLRALCLSRALFAAVDAMEHGERDASSIAAQVEAEMQDVEIDYVAIVDAFTMAPVETISSEVVVAVAAKVGAARLIDNVRFDPARVPAPAK